MTAIEKQIKRSGLDHPEEVSRLSRHALPLRRVAAVFVRCFPVIEPPTGSLSTTAALALCVFVAVPFFGIGTRHAADT